MRSQAIIVPLLSLLLVLCLLVSSHHFLAFVKGTLGVFEFLGIFRSLGEFENVFKIWQKFSNFGKIKVIIKLNRVNGKCQTQMWWVTKNKQIGNGLRDIF